MKNKYKVGLLLAFVVMTIVCVNLVSAAVSNVSILTPSNASTIGGTEQLFNITINNVAAGSAFGFGCNVSAKSATTANSSFSQIIYIKNNTLTTDHTNHTNATFNPMLALEDSNDYVFNVTCWNTTAKWTSVLLSGMTIDSGVPTAATSHSPTDGTVDTDGALTFSGTVVGENTTGCTLYFVGTNPGNSNYSMTHSADSCSVSLTSIPSQTYEWYILATDNLNNTASTSTKFAVETSQSAHKIGALLSDPRVVSTGGNSFAVISSGTIAGIPIIVIVVVLIGGIVIYIINKRG